MKGERGQRHELVKQQHDMRIGIFNWGNIKSLHTFIHVTMRRGTVMTFCSCRNTWKKGKRTKDRFSPCLCCFMSKFQRGKADSFFFFCQQSSFKRLLPAPSFIFPRCSYLGRRYRPGTSAGRPGTGVFFVLFLLFYIRQRVKLLLTHHHRSCPRHWDDEGRVRSRLAGRFRLPVGLRHGRCHWRRLPRNARKAETYLDCVAFSLVPFGPRSRALSHPLVPNGALP